MLATKVLIKPLLTEKTHQLLKRDVYVFLVHPSAAKNDVKSAFQVIFNVQVTSVNLTIRKRKPKTMGRFHGFKKQQKKAYITLAPNQNFTFLKEAEQQLTTEVKPKKKGWSFFNRFQRAKGSTSAFKTPIPAGERKEK